MVNVCINKPNFSAKGIYKDGKMTVCKGSSINPSFASYIKGIALAKECRDNKELVDEQWIVLFDYEFPSPTTAAQFVMGQSRDGYDVWKLEDGKSLGKYLEEHGIRERRRRKKAQ